MIKYFTTLCAICSFLSIYTAADIMNEQQQEPLIDIGPVKYQYKTILEHDIYKPTPIDKYWKHAKQDEKSVMAICTDSEINNISAKNAQFEGLAKGRMDKMKFHQFENQKLSCGY